METRRGLRRRLAAALLATTAAAPSAPALNSAHEEIATAGGPVGSHASRSHLLESTLRPPAYRLWEEAGFGGQAVERAAWVLAVGPDHLVWRTWPDEHGYLRAHWTGAVPEDAVAIVHTHPAKVDPKPSPQDIETARRLGLPVYTVSRVGIWKAEPDGLVVAVDDARWWSGCRSGGCSAPERDPEFRSARGVSDSRNLAAESAYR
jgi:JAB domain-containing protein similar to deubiquitination enzymes